MNPQSFVFWPVETLWNAVARPLRAIFVVGLCYLINRFTSPGYPWWHWVALGMGISVLVAWARAFRTIVLLVAAFYVGRWIYRNHGAQAKARFDDWMAARAASDRTTPGGPGAQVADPKDALRLIGNDQALRNAGIIH